MLQFINIKIVVAFLFVSILLTSCRCNEEPVNKKDPTEKKKEYLSEDIIKCKELFKSLNHQFNPSVMGDFEIIERFVIKDLNNFYNLDKHNALALMNQLQLDNRINYLKILRAILKKAAKNPYEYDLAGENTKDSLNEFIKKIKVENIDTRLNTQNDDPNYLFTKNNFSRAYLLVSDILEMMEIVEKLLESRIYS